MEKVRSELDALQNELTSIFDDMGEDDASNPSLGGSSYRQAQSLS